MAFVSELTSFACRSFLAGARCTALFLALLDHDADGEGKKREYDGSYGHVGQDGDKHRNLTLSQGR
jgi:hypothetical protein